MSDYETRARSVLPDGLFSVLFGSYGDAGWEANTHNLDGFQRVELRPRIMVDVSAVNTATSVLGQEIALPVLTGPAGAHQRFHSDAELATARATAAAGSVMVLSTGATYSVEEVAAENAGGPLWFQLYCLKNRDLTVDLIRRAERNGYRAIVVTVDNPGVRSSERDDRHGIPFHGKGRIATLEPGRVRRNFQGREGPGVPTAETFHEELETALSWSYFDWLRSTTSLPLVVKGVQTGEDAIASVRHGAEAVIVSNHGGHALHDATATITILPEIVEAVGGQAEVYLDGGIRRGSDVLKALALGARAVLIGRAYLWGLTVDGEAGVRHVYDLIREELQIAMRYCGVPDVAHVPTTMVRPPAIGRRGTIVELQALVDLLDREYITRAEFDVLKLALLASSESDESQR